MNLSSETLSDNQEKKKEEVLDKYNRLIEIIYDRGFRDFIIDEEYCKNKEKEDLIYFINLLLDYIKNTPDFYDGFDKKTEKENINKLCKAKKYYGIINQIGIIARAYFIKKFREVGILTNDMWNKLEIEMENHRNNPREAIKILHYKNKIQELSEQIKKEAPEIIREQIQNKIKQILQLENRKSYYILKNLSSTVNKINKLLGTKNIQEFGITVNLSNIQINIDFDKY